MKHRSTMAITLLSVACTGGSAPVAVPQRDILYTSWSEARAEQIWRMRPDGTGARSVTHSTEGVDGSFAVWSPDGLSIAFSGQSRIFVMDADGSKIRAIGPESIALQGAPDWSPDGQEIVFSGGMAGLERDLYVVNVDGSNVRQLTAGPGIDQCPRWSPDGGRILFARDNNQLQVLSVETGDIENALPEGWQGHCGDWSPDGAALTFSSGPDGTRPSMEEAMAGARILGEIFVLRLGSGAVQHIPEAGRLSHYPRWSRDGSRIVFQGRFPPGQSLDPGFRSGPTDAELYTVTLDGVVVRLTENGVLDAHPNW